MLATREGYTSDIEGLWIGQLYSHGLEPVHTSVHQEFAHVKGISPVQHTFQIGLHMGAGCVLPHPFNGCSKDHKGFCYKPHDFNEQKLRFNTKHYFDEIVHRKDLIAIDKATGGVLFHVLINRIERLVNIKTKLDVVNEYTSNHFPQIKTVLRARRLDLIVEAPYAKRLLYPIKRYEPDGVL